MNRIDELIAKICPNGVALIKIDDLISYEQPTPYLVEGIEYDDSFTTPVLTAGQTFILGYTNEEFGIYKASFSAPVIIFDDFTTAAKWVDFDFKAKSSAMKMLKPKDPQVINLRYFWHYLPSIEIDISQHTRYWISKFSLEKIPVPPIEVQNAIVRILDTFSELEAELEAELDARKKQYAFYRESLFESRDENVEIKTIDEISTIWRGRRFVKDDILDEGVPAVHYGEIYTKYGLSATEAFSYLDHELASKLRFAKAGDVILVSAGETIEDIGKSFVWFGEEDVVIHDACYGIRSSIVDSKYMVHFFNTYSFRSQLQKYISTSKISSISTEKLGKVFIPVPPLAKQQEIARQLDKFDDLVSLRISEEINARRKQYEYYRDKLLTFKKIEAT